MIKNRVLQFVIANGRIKRLKLLRLLQPPQDEWIYGDEPDFDHIDEPSNYIDNK